MADQVLGQDGTQEPAPPPPLSDPLAGLVTGAGYQAEPDGGRSMVEPVSPDALLPDAEEIRRQVDASLAAEDLLGGTEADEEATGKRDGSPATGAAAGPPRPWPSALAMVRRLPKLLRTSPVVRVAAARPQVRFSPGIGLVIALLVVVLVIAYYLVLSFVDTISQLFT